MFDLVFCYIINFKKSKLFTVIRTVNILYPVYLKKKKKLNNTSLDIPHDPSNPFAMLRLHLEPAESLQATNTQAEHMHSQNFFFFF